MQSDGIAEGCLIIAVVGGILIGIVLAWGGSWLFHHVHFGIV